MLIPRIKDNASAQLEAVVQTSSSGYLLQAGGGDAFPQPKNGAATSAGNQITLNSVGIQDAGVVKGDILLNLTDSTPETRNWSCCVVVTVSADQVTTTPLYGGTNNTWADGDDWVIDPFVVNFSKRTGGLLTGAVTAFEKVLITGRSGDTISSASASGFRGFDETGVKAFSAGDFVTIEVDQSFGDGIKAMLQALFSDPEGVLQLMDISTPQSIAGLKTFLTLPESTEDPVNDNQLARRSWIIDQIASQISPSSLSEALELEGFETLSLNNDLLAMVNPTAAPTVALGASSQGVNNGPWEFTYSHHNAAGETMVAPSDTITVLNGDEVLVTFPSAASHDSGGAGTYVYARFTNGDNKWRRYGEVDENATSFTFALDEGDWLFDLNSVTATTDQPIDVSFAPITNWTINNPGFSGGSKQFGSSGNSGYWTIAYAFVTDDGQISDQSPWSADSSLFNYSTDNRHWSVISALQIPGNPTLPPVPENGSPWVGIIFRVEFWSAAGRTGILRFTGGGAAIVSSSAADLNANGDPIIPLPADTTVNWDAKAQQGIANWGQFNSGVPTLTNTQFVSFEEVFESKVPVVSNTTEGLQMKIEQQVPFGLTLLFAINGQQPPGSIYANITGTVNGQLVRGYFVPAT